MENVYCPDMLKEKDKGRSSYRRISVEKGDVEMPVKLQKKLRYIKL